MAFYVFHEAAPIIPVKHVLSTDTQYLVSVQFTHLMEVDIIANANLARVTSFTISITNKKPLILQNITVKKQEYFWVYDGVSDNIPVLLQTVRPIFSTIDFVVGVSGIENNIDSRTTIADSLIQFNKYKQAYNLYYDFTVVNDMPLTQILDINQKLYSAQNNLYIGVLLQCVLPSFEYTLYNNIIKGLVPPYTNAVYPSHIKTEIILNFKI